MAKTNPQDAKNRQVFSTNLNQLMKKQGIRQVDIHRSLNIPKSTITGYVKGTSLPNNENIEKLAKFFKVDKSEIDPRFATEPKTPADNYDLDAMLDNAHSYDGKPLDDHDRELIRQYLKALLNK